MQDELDSGDASSGAEQRLIARARMHAALGEPLRLTIADRLTLGDASPGELSAATGLATNLLAHHLRVMEDAGLIRRARSEGDRRRSYVQLRWEDDAVAALVNANTTSGLLNGPVPRVVFVCTHNSARSQLAAQAWAVVSDIPVASAGTHPAADEAFETAYTDLTHRIRRLAAALIPATHSDRSRPVPHAQHGTRP